MTSERADMERWPSLFAVLRNFELRLEKLDSQMQAMRGLLSLMDGKLDTIHEAVLWEDDEEDDDDASDLSFIVPDGEGEESEESESEASAVNGFDSGSESA